MLLNATPGGRQYQPRQCYPMHVTAVYTHYSLRNGDYVGCFMAVKVGFYEPASMVSSNLQETMPWIPSICNICAALETLVAGGY